MISPEPFEMANALPCPGCGVVFDLDADAFAAHFADEGRTCPRCNQRIDLWVAVRDWVRDWFMFGMALQLAGATNLVVKVPLEPGAVVEVNLQDYGVPSDAELIRLNLTGIGGISGELLHSNEVFPDPIPIRFCVRGVALSGVEASQRLLQVSATWFARKPDDTCERHLVEAARHFSAGRYDAVVVPANIAVEASITPVVADALVGFAGKKVRENFLQNAATYSYQLNVLVPMIAFMVRAPSLPIELRGLLNRLRGLRNDVGHEGRCAAQTKQAAAEHLAAAIFGVRYAAMLAGFVTKAKAERLLPGTAPGE